MTHWLVAAALLLSFVLMYRQNADGRINAYALQGGVVAAAVAWQGWLLGEWGYAALAVAGGLARGVGLPLLLRRCHGGEAGGRAVLMLALGLGVVGVAAMLARTLRGISAPEDLAAALAVVGIGVVVLAVQRSAVGLLSMENGAALLAAGLPGSPLLTAGGLALAGCVVLATAEARG